MPKEHPKFFSMGVRVDQILAQVGREAPVELAYAWDRVGLLIGSEHQEVNKLVVALEASEAVLQGAVAVGAQMVLSHHPLLFQPIQRFCTDKPLERAVAYAIKHDLAVAAAHTNLDIAKNGLNVYLAQLLGLTQTGPLEITKNELLIKLTVFVPVGYEDLIREAVSRVGAGIIGNYSDCSFSVRGQGTYKAGTGAQPWRGLVSELNRVVESRLEMVIPEGLVLAALEALKAVHPYEEVAYDLYPLKNKGITFGIGQVGEWTEPRPFQWVTAELKQIFNSPCLKMIGKPPILVKRVAVCGGSGGEFISRAREREQIYTLPGISAIIKRLPGAKKIWQFWTLGTLPLRSFLFLNGDGG